MSKTISFALNVQSVDKAIKELEAYKVWVEQKTKELTERLARIGATEAAVRFGSAYYTGTNDVSVTVNPISNGWEISADGKAVCFIEFGSGVYFNGDEPYPNPRPKGVVGIGEYGKGKGSNDFWWYTSENGGSRFTHGTPSAMPMYHASREMRQAVLQIAKEVFG